jgi:MFS family permease
MDSSSEPSGRFTALRNRNFTKVWSAGVTSQVGDWALSVGLVFYVYLLTGSTLATGLALIFSVVPQALTGLVAGVYVDRWSRKRTMIAVNLILASGLVPLLLVHGAAEIWIVYAVIAFESAIDAFFSPAEGALIPEIVAKELLLQSNSIYGTGRQAARLTGAALGGLLVGLFGLAGVTWVDLASFLVAAAVLSTVFEPPREVARPAPAVEGSADTGPRGFRAEWREGAAQARASQVAWAILIVSSIVYVGEGVFGTLVAPFVVTVLHGSSVDYGLFLSLQSVGGIVGGVSIALAASRMDPKHVVPVTAVIFGAMDLVLFNYPLFAPGILIAFVLIILIGLPASAFGASYTVLLQTGVPAPFRGRYISVVQTIGLISMTSGALLAGLLGPTLGIIPLLEIQGSVYVVGGLVLYRQLGGLAPSSSTTHPATSSDVP